MQTHGDHLDSAAGRVNLHRKERSVDRKLGGLGHIGKVDWRRSRSGGGDCGGSFLTGNDRLAAALQEVVRRRVVRLEGHRRLCGSSGGGSSSSSSSSNHWLGGRSLGVVRFQSQGGRVERLGGSRRRRRNNGRSRAGRRRRRSTGACRRVGAAATKRRRPLSSSSAC